jgi:SAM-dependent methyltransferase
VELPDRTDFLDCSEPRPPGGSALGSTRRQRAKHLIRRILRGDNDSARRLSERFLATVKARTARPKILVVGGGTIGAGAESLYRDPDICLIGTDVFASPHTVLVTDGHKLPFADESIDGVWIQAVLEHVLSPDVVVAQIHRVLKQDGVVYAGTPFMQQVHMGAFDFTRFTLSGHRWLFRQFEQIEAGFSGGAGMSAIWSIRYLARALGAGPALAGGIAGLFFWLRFLDRLAKPRESADAASGVYFLGRKSARTLTPKDMPAYYESSGEAA